MMECAIYPHLRQMEAARRPVKRTETSPSQAGQLPAISISGGVGRAASGFEVVSLMEDTVTHVQGVARGPVAGAWLAAVATNLETAPEKSTT